MSLTIEGLTVRIPVRGDAVVHAVTDVSLTVPEGTVSALVGESGCGKSVVAGAVLGVLPPSAVVTGSVRVDVGELAFDVLDQPLGSGRIPRRRGTFGWRGWVGRRDGHAGPPTRNAVTADPGHATSPAAAAHSRAPRTDAAAHRFRGRTIALIPQSPGTHFTPVRTIGSQLTETIATLGTDHTPADLLALAGLPASALELYPHELSGGMAQRAAVAAALAGDPAVIVADEPTSGLDRDRTDQIGLLLRACADRGAAVLLITHDLGHLLRAGIADTVAIMYASRLMEVGPAPQVLADPWHDYTGDLLAALPERGLRPLPHPPLALTDLSDDCPYAGGPTVLRREGPRLIRRARS
ncbi:ATP-binding cassette domain-containing protein [Nocardia rhizosphaerae]|uniref:Nickel import system ATP-binding protein NikD n=1 Tax=Nocardia rhizosphaerae TaxID=1691571 RepID=A0ABV8L5E7_9NOCA